MCLGLTNNRQNLEDRLRQDATSEALSTPHSGLAKSLARRPGAIVFSSRATKMYHRPARRSILNTGLPQVFKNSSI